MPVPVHVPVHVSVYLSLVPSSLFDRLAVWWGLDVFVPVLSVFVRPCIVVTCPAGARRPCADSALARANMNSTCANPLIYIMVCRVVQQLEAHGMNLIGLHQPSRAVSLLTQALAKRAAAALGDTGSMLSVANNLGVALLDANHCDAAISVFAKVWRDAKGVWEADDPDHVILYKNYARALVRKQDHSAHWDLRYEAAARGMSDLSIVTPEEREQMNRRRANQADEGQSSQAS